MGLPSVIRKGGGVNQIKATFLRNVVFIFSGWQAQTGLALRGLPSVIRKGGASTRSRQHSCGMLFLFSQTGKLKRVWLACLRK